MDFDRDLPVILITAHGDIATAVEAMRIGAYDFVQKPYGADRLVECVRRGCEKRRLVMDNRRLRSQLHSATIEGKLLGNSRAIANVRRAISELGPTNANVIIRGETGVGKEVVARSLHNLSPRSGGPFLAINCGAIPEAMFESELFGHEAGAFTSAGARRVGKFEYASGGTVLFDEIESMPLGAQVKLLRVLQERSVERLGSNRAIPIDVRILAATQIDLREATRKGNFRADLYYRLAVAEIVVPPLTERRDDIPLLFDYFVFEAARLYGRERRSLAPEHLGILTTHCWTGNVRELKNAAERYVLSTGGFSLDSVVRFIEAPGPMVGHTALTLSQQVDEFERGVLVSALETSKGDIRLAMELLGIPRRTLNEKMRRHGVAREKFLGPSAERVN
jgi:two-component system C4-dicarboxylate transport response regulator DctD